MRLPRMSSRTMMLIGLVAIAFILSESVRVRKARRLGSSSRRLPARRSVSPINFSCTGRPVGYYADVDFDCRVFHICDNFGRRIPIHCPPHTAFNQMYRVCDWPSNVDCKDSATWFYMNGEQPDNQQQQQPKDSISSSERTGNSTSNDVN